MLSRFGNININGALKTVFGLMYFSLLFATTALTGIRLATAKTDRHIVQLFSISADHTDVEAGGAAADNRFSSASGRNSDRRVELDPTASGLLLHDGGRANPHPDAGKHNAGDNGPLAADEHEKNKNRRLQQQLPTHSVLFGPIPALPEAASDLENAAQVRRSRAILQQIKKSAGKVGTTQEVEVGSNGELPDPQVAGAGHDEETMADERALLSTRKPKAAAVTGAAAPRTAGDHGAVGAGKPVTILSVESTVGGPAATTAARQDFSTKFGAGANASSASADADENETNKTPPYRVVTGRGNAHASSPRSRVPSQYPVRDAYTCTTPTARAGVGVAVAGPEAFLRRRWMSLEGFCQTLQLSTDSALQYRVCFGTGSFTVEDLVRAEVVTFGSFDDRFSLLPLQEVIFPSGAEGDLHTDKMNNEGSNYGGGGGEEQAQKLGEPPAPAKNEPGRTFVDIDGYENPGERYYSQLFFDEDGAIGGEVRCFCGSGPLQFQYLDLQLRESEVAKSLAAAERQNATGTTEDDSPEQNVKQRIPQRDSTVDDDIVQIREQRRTLRAVAKATHPVCCKHLSASNLLSQVDQPVKATHLTAPDAFSGDKITALSFYTRLKFLYREKSLYVVPYEKQGELLTSLPKRLLSMGYKRVFGGLHPRRHPAVRHKITNCPHSAVYFICPLLPEWVVDETGSHTHVAFVTDGYELSDEFLEAHGRGGKNKDCGPIKKQARRSIFFERIGQDEMPAARVPLGSRDHVGAAVPPPATEAADLPRDQRDTVH
eukprot:g5163.t1